ncbi:MAG TPA: cysteine desulfurase [Spirochaetia bacterium]|nr:cysteine desulfurase [Spirochaetia bacterium]
MSDIINLFSDTGEQTDSGKDRISLDDRRKREPGESIRKDFPILKRAFWGKALAYLDNAATTQKPYQVLHAIYEQYAWSNANVHRAIHRLGEEATAAYEESRKAAQMFINARLPSEIIFTRGTTESVNLVASSWGRKHLRPGEEILLTEMEHHSNLIPWQLLARDLGCTLRFLPITETGTLDLEALPRLFTDRVRLVAITHVSNVLGTVNPLRRIIRFAHAREVPVLIDSAQGVPHLPVDVQELDCDFLAFSGHKMCGPTGIGVLYGKEELLDDMPPYMGGGEMISAVWLDRAEWNELPYKFEAGTPNIAGAVGFGSALKYLSGLGMENIARYEAQLTTYALERMGEVPGLRVYGSAPSRSGVISFNLGSVHAHDVAQFLDHAGIAVRAGHHCAQPLMRRLGVPATVRASFYLYNAFEEVDRLVDALKQAGEFFNRGL